MCCASSFLRPRVEMYEGGPRVDWWEGRKSVSPEEEKLDDDEEAEEMFDEEEAIDERSYERGERVMEGMAMGLS
jgi:hypothetical protein